jgi:hypothetical protein
MTQDAAGSEEVKAEIDRLLQRQADSDPFSPEIVRQAEDIVSALSGDWPHPSIGRGYWKTIIFNWGGTAQLEIFPDRIEVYRFNGEIDVRDFNHKPGQPLPPGVFCVHFQREKFKLTHDQRHTRAAHQEKLADAAILSLPAFGNSPQKA